MAYQLIYTSVRRGLIPGRSGYTVAARHRQIRDRLVSELERISSYTFAKSGSSPVVHAHRKLRVSGTDFHVLSRIVDAGSDYTGRTNHLAHHLVCEPDELAACKATPAEVMREFGWRDRYDEEPRYLGDDEVVDLGGFSEVALLPGAAWKSIRGEAADAALPLGSNALRAGAIFVTPDDDTGGQQKVLDLFAESLQLAALDARDPTAAWQIPFTTYLQPADDLAEFKWVGCGPSDALPAKPGRRVVFDLAGLSQPVPDSALAKLAISGRVVKPPPKPTPPRPTPSPSLGTAASSTSTRPPSTALKPPGEAAAAGALVLNSYPGTELSACAHRGRRFLGSFGADSPG